MVDMSYSKVCYIFRLTMNFYYRWVHDDVIKCKHFPRYWPFVRGSHRTPVNSPKKGQWRGALMFLWYAPWINVCVHNREAGDLRRHRARCGVIVMDIDAILWTSSRRRGFTNKANTWIWLTHTALLKIRQQWRMGPMRYCASALFVCFHRVSNYLE